MRKVSAVYFDMDGVLADLYNVDGWLDCLINEDSRPYHVANSLVNPHAFTRLVNTLQHNGIHCGIISWGSKNSSQAFLQTTRRTKINWLQSTYGIQWDSIDVIPYGVGKWTRAVNDSILVDDEMRNREEWRGMCAIDGGAEDWTNKLLALLLE